MNISKFRDSDVLCAHGEKSIGRFTIYFMVVQTKTYAALVWTISKSISDKKKLTGEKSDSFTPKSLFWTSKQPFAYISFLASCSVCPVAIPKIFAKTLRSNY